MKSIYIHLVFLLNSLSCFSENCDSIKRYDNEYLIWKKHGFWTANLDIDSTMRELPCYIENFKRINSLSIINPIIENWPDSFFKINGIRSIYLSNINNINSNLILSKLHLVENLTEFWISNTNLTNIKFCISDSINDIKLINFNCNNLPISIKNPVKLDLLRIDDSTFSKIDSVFYSFKNLRTLFIDNSNLNYLPDFIYKMQSLFVLSLNNAKFINSFDILKKISVMNNVQYLNFCKNKLKKIPKEIFKMELKGINLVDNDIEFISDGICKLKNLEYLGLGNNKLKYIPKSIGKLKKSLKELNLIGNKLSDKEKEKIKRLLPNTKIYFEE